MPRRNATVSESKTLSQVRDLLAEMRLGGDNDRLRDAAQMLVEKLLEQVTAGVHTNPTDNAVITDDLEKIFYTHAQDGEAYVHTFEDGVRVLLLGDPGAGCCALMYRPDGRDVWDEFETDDGDDDDNDDDEDSDAD